MCPGENLPSLCRGSKVNFFLPRSVVSSCNKVCAWALPLLGFPTPFQMRSPSISVHACVIFGLRVSTLFSASLCHVHSFCSDRTPQVHKCHLKAHSPCDSGASRPAGTASHSVPLSTGGRDGQLSALPPGPRRAC